MPDHLTPQHFPISHPQHHQPCPEPPSPGPQLLVPEDIFQVASINRLLRFVSIITAQYVGVEPREICQARWNQWQRLTAALGLAEEALALTLDAPSRALLLLLQSCAAHGNKTATFTVRGLPACWAEQGGALGHQEDLVFELCQAPAHALVCICSHGQAPWLLGLLAA